MKERKDFADTTLVDVQMRKRRAQAGKLTSVTNSLMRGPVASDAAPVITVANYNHSQTLPGTPVANPGSATDLTAKRAFDETHAVAAFY